MAAGTKRTAAAPLHIPSLDGVRAVSFLIVFLGHAGLGKLVPGYFGLSLFFFLSGYLITTLLRVEFDRSGTISLSQFYLRRVLRIFPPFYLILAVASVLSASGWLGGSLWPSAVLAQCSHLTNYWVVAHGWWNGMAPGTWVYWSLAVEEHFYLVFPLAYRAMARARWSPGRQALTLLAFCALVLVWRCALIFLLGAGHDRTYVSSDTRVDSIIAGCILAIVGNPVLDDIDPVRLLRLWLPLGAMSVALSLGVRAFWFDQTLRYSLQSFGLLPFFVAAIYYHDRLAFRWLNTKILRYLGALSYSMYLMHTALLWGLERHLHWPTAARSALALVLLVLFGSIIYRYIEKPCARARRRLSALIVPAGVA